LTLPLLVGNVADGRGLVLRLPAVRHSESKERPDATPVELLDYMFPRGPPAIVVLMTCGSALPQQVLDLYLYCAQHLGTTVVLALRRKAADDDDDDDNDNDDRVGLMPVRVLPVLASALQRFHDYEAGRRHRALCHRRRPSARDLYRCDC
jgi:hypothetical protein